MKWADSIRRMVSFDQVADISALLPRSRRIQTWNLYQPIMDVWTKMTGATGCPIGP